MPAFPNQAALTLSLPTVQGNTFTLSESRPEKFTIVIFYRGNHCPICKMHLKEIEEHYSSLKEAGFDVVVVSMDTKEKAEATLQEVATTLNQETLQVPVAYGLTLENVRNVWNLFASSCRPGTNEPTVYSEPGMYVIRPSKEDSNEEPTVFMAQMQSAPFTRPSMEQLQFGLSYAYDNNYPTRGTYSVSN